jgi:FPC/CPF motif-containing protein YcgG
LNVNTTLTDSQICDEYLSFIGSPQFACVAARAALASQQIKCFVAGHMACPGSDTAILDFIYNFVDEYRSANSLFHSATIIFKGPVIPDEESFDRFLWQRLQSLSDLDAQNYSYDDRVSNNPSSADFSFSLKEEAFFIIGLHPQSSRMTRRFAYPTIVFNPHDQFETLRQENHYESMKRTVRKRDIKLSGSINPMLDDYRLSSEALQYSGKKYDSSWQCPLHVSHAESKHNSAT